ncbi:MAG: glucose PTS transporter subunit IIA [Blautia sp.]|nr:glucose PTS transporter subunit IIA [Blautia sp.]MCM1200729.1 glucose PTS transporter subunit IIA [Bacteroides fragilis]
MGKYDDLAKRIIERIGGRENIVSLTHCATKIRFCLKDEAKADTRALKTMPGVITAIQRSGQYQLVIGNHAPDVCKAVSGRTGISDLQEAEEREKGWLGRSMDFVSGIFAPLISVFCAVGVLKGAYELFSYAGFCREGNAIWQPLQMLSDSLFYYLPVFIGFTAARKFQINQFTGMLLGACFVYPHRFGIAEHSYSILPVVLAVWAASYIERFLKKILPELWRIFLVPLLTLLCTVPLAFLVIEAVYTGLIAVVMIAINGSYAASPVLAGALTGLFWPLLVVLGVHRELTGITVDMIMINGFQEAMEGAFLPAVAYIASWAQAGAVLAVLFRTREKRMRSISIPSVISGFMGIAEPGIYGVALPEKKPFFISSACAAAGGALFAFLASTYKGTTVINGFPFAIVASLPVFALSWLVTMFVYRESKKESIQFSTLPFSLDGKKVIHSPLNGKLVPLMEVGDEVFSSGVLGEGIAIEPYEGIVYAPADCKVTTFFPTGHAIGLTTAEGVELLIHIGVDTAQLNGKYFKPLVKQGEKLTDGQPMLEFDSKRIGQEGYRITTSVIVTNTTEWKKVDSTTARETTVGDALLWLG